VRTFRVACGAQLASCLVAAVVAALVVAAYWSGGWSWVSLSLVGMTVFALAGLADILTARVELLDDRLVVVRNLRNAATSARRS
jgi:hypothetical protein